MRRTNAQPVDVEVEMSVSQGALFARRQSHRQWPREPRQREHNVTLRYVMAKRPALRGALNKLLHERLCAGPEIRPMRLLQQRTNDVHRPDPVIKCLVHVLAECIDTVGNGFDQFLSGAYALVQHVAGGGMKKRLLVGEVPVESANANAGALGNSISYRLASYFQDQLYRRLNEPLSVSLRICPHRKSQNCPQRRSLTKT